MNPQFQDAFRRLDTEEMARLSALPGSDATDGGRVLAAFAALAEDDADRAEELLRACTGDGTISDADHAYVAAFLMTRQGALEEAAAMLERHFSDPDATHPHRMRLRAAECRLETGSLQAACDDLGPLLQPPGCDDTLEAQAIVLEAMLLSNWEREKIIEQVSLLDGLVERGFRMREGENVLALGELLSAHKVEGLQQRLYAAHRPLLEAIRTDDPEQIRFLLAEGLKWKSGGLVIASARSYEEVPFAWGEDAEAAAFQFAHHEEFAAAAALLDATFAEDEIHARGDLWGPLLLCQYHSEQWGRALGTISRHWGTIDESPQRLQTLLMRAACRHHLGDHAGCLADLEAIGPDLASIAEPHEAACLVKSLRALGRGSEATTRAQELLVGASGKPEWTPYFLNALVNQSLFTGDESLFRDALALLTGAIAPPQCLAHISGLGELALAWSLPRHALSAADALDAAGDGARARLLRILAAAEESPDRAASCIGELGALASEQPGIAPEVDWQAARLLYRLGQLGEAMRVARQIANTPGSRRRHLALEMAARLFEETSPEMAVELRQEAREAVRLPGAGADVAALREDERAHLLDEDRPGTLAARLDVVRGRAPSSSEVIRLERRLEWLNGWIAAMPPAGGAS